MPEYLAPGVYVEEVSFRAKTIEGVSTTTTGFVGPARYGPVDLEPDIITSIGQFERIYGDRQKLKFSDTVKPLDNYLWHAARAFFEEGGKRLYIARTFNPNGDTADGRADAWLPDTPPNPAGEASRLRISARFPGEAGKMRVRLTLRLGPNVLSGTSGNPTAAGLQEFDVVWISDLTGSPPASPIEEAARNGNFYLVTPDTDPVTFAPVWRFVGLTQSPPLPDLDLTDLRPDPNPKLSDEIRVVTMTVTTMPEGESDLPPAVWSDLALDPRHKRAGRPDSVFAKFAAKPTNRSDELRLPIVLDLGSGIEDNDGTEILRLLFNAQAGNALASPPRESLEDALQRSAASEAERSIDLLLDGGNDGARPAADDYEGADTNDRKTGLKAFEDIEDISIVAAPGSTFGYGNGYGQNAATIINHLISHAERMRYRIAVIDSGDGQTIADTRAMRGRIDSKYAAFYYPWVKVLDPLTQTELNLPPSGFISGIYARNDIERAVYKAPANEVVRLALGFERTINKAEQEVLNPEGVNCLRFFEGRGYRVWGARTTTSDPEWKYVNLRRYFAYLERSIDRGTQWAVFEPNNELLWANVRQTIQDFLFNEWVMGGLLGEKPEKAYFVRCDRSTMTQNDLDNGRLVCLIGIAVSRPAEFVIFRIGQWTGDRKG